MIQSPLCQVERSLPGHQAGGSLWDQSYVLQQADGVSTRLQDTNQQRKVEVRSVQLQCLFIFELSLQHFGSRTEPGMLRRIRKRSWPQKMKTSRGAGCITVIDECVQQGQYQHVALVTFSRVFSSDNFSQSVIQLVQRITACCLLLSETKQQELQSSLHNYQIDWHEKYNDDVFFLGSVPKQYVPLHLQNMNVWPYLLCRTTILNSSITHQQHLWFACCSCIVEIISWSIV